MRKAGTPASRYWASAARSRHPRPTGGSKASCTDRVARCGGTSAGLCNGPWNSVVILATGVGTVCSEDSKCSLVCHATASDRVGVSVVSNVALHRSGVDVLESGSWSALFHRQPPWLLVTRSTVTSRPGGRHTGSSHLCRIRIQPRSSSTATRRSRSCVWLVDGDGVGKACRMLGTARPKKPARKQAA